MNADQKKPASAMHSADTDPERAGATGGGHIGAGLPGERVVRFGLPFWTTAAAKKHLRLLAAEKVSRNSSFWPRLWIYCSRSTGNRFAPDRRKLNSRASTTNRNRFEVRTPPTKRKAADAPRETMV